MPLLEHFDRRLHRQPRVCLVAAKRQISDDKGAMGTARDCLAVQQHVVQGDGERRVMAVHNHAHRVANQQDVYASAVNLCAFVETTKTVVLSAHTWTAEG